MPNYDLPIRQQRYKMLSQRLTMVFIGESGGFGVELTTVQLWLVKTRRKCRKHPTSTGDTRTTKTCTKTTRNTDFCEPRQNRCFGLKWLLKAHLITAIETAELNHPGRELRPCASHRLPLPRLLFHHNAGSTLHIADCGSNLMLKANGLQALCINMCECECECVCSSQNRASSILYPVSSPHGYFRAGIGCAGKSKRETAERS